MPRAAHLQATRVQVRWRRPRQSSGRSTDRSDRAPGAGRVGDLPDRAVAPTAQLDDLGLELGRERPPRPRLAGFHALHDGHPPRGTTSDIGVRQTRSGPGPPPMERASVWARTNGGRIQRSPARDATNQIISRWTALPSGVGCADAELVTVVAGEVSDASGLSSEDLLDMVGDLGRGAPNPLIGRECQHRFD
jgi:hypothetical protein